MNRDLSANHNACRGVPPIHLNPGHLHPRKLILIAVLLGGILVVHLKEGAFDPGSQHEVWSSTVKESTNAIS